MTILATGGAGYIGSQCVLDLIDAGRKVVVYDDLSSGQRALVPHQATLVLGDVRDPTHLHRVIRDHRVTTIFHFAALISVPESFERPVDYYDVNVGGLVQVLKALAGTEVSRLVFSSTAAVYGPQEQPIAETDVIAPSSPYGESKLMAERVLQAAAKASGLAYVILRYFNAAGADPEMRAGQCNERAANLFASALNCAEGRSDALEIFGSDYDTLDGTGVRDFIHVKDLADLHLRALLWLESGQPSEVFNCGYGRGASVLEVVRAVEAATGISLPLRRCPRRPGDQPSVLADSTKVQKMLDWSPRWESLEDMATHAWAWRRRWRNRQSVPCAKAIVAQ